MRDDRPLYVAERPLKLDIWTVQRNPLGKPDAMYRLLEIRRNKKDATETATTYNKLVADCEYRAWKYIPLELSE